MNEEIYDRELARIIDHTLLRTDVRKEDFDRVCDEAKALPLPVGLRLLG